MRERFDEIRAERDVHAVEPVVYNRDPHAGLWKQIALGIVVGYLALGVLSAVGWAVAVRFAMGGLQIAVP
jgi:ABC-type transport system involved in cytochrome c biogenesis permease component